MQLGMMNDPRLDVCDEVRWTAEHGFDFLDLTIEGPAADLEHLDIPAVQAVVAETGLSIVGHTAPYLPFASPVARLRRAAVECVVDTFEVFASLGAQWVNVHIAFAPALFSRQDWLAWNAESFRQIAERAEPYGLQVMVEHPPSPLVGVAEVRKVLDADARLGFHLDVGHAHVGGDRLGMLLKAFAARMAHVHLSDNRGKHDDHRTLGDGWIDWPRAIRLLKQSGYDGTITLEVQSPDRDYVLLSAQKLRRWWDETLSSAATESAGEE
jgi:sugar phosphate isomerase/epimerase